MSTDLETKTKVKTKKPQQYVVVLHNDDFTPRSYVVEILRKFFTADETMAAKIMLTAHIEGKAACMMTTREIAETKVEAVTNYISESTYPLIFTYEPS